MPKRFFSRILSPLLLVLLGAAAVSASAAELQLQRVNKQVYAIVGPLGNRSPANFGDNATFGFVVTAGGVVLIDSGATRRGAEAIHQLIRGVTDKPIKVVINTGGQDHRWLGNGYFKQLGARIIASRKAVEDQRARAQDQFFMLGNLVGEAGLKGTEAVYADQVFDRSLTFTLGKTRFELHHTGPAHTPGDSFVWLPDDGVVFTGDIVFVERMPGVLAHSNSRGWVEAFKAIAALNPKVVVPGHGRPTTLDKARADTYDYLVFLRKSIGDFMNAGGGIEAVGTLDQSRFKYLKNYDTLAGRNAQQVYSEMEWE